MQTKAIIFDKDGTLIDFDSFWVTISEYAIEDMLITINRKDIPKTEILEALGVRNGVTSINGVLCHGTYKTMAESIYAVLEKYGYAGDYKEIEKLTLQAHQKYSDKGIVKGTCDNIKEFFDGLKKQGFILAVVTTDIPSVTNHCLKALGILEYFDEIYTDDGTFLPKPAPDTAFDLCKKYQLDLSQIVMVGDTKTDINFAKNANIRAICVAKTEENKKILLEETDTVVSDISAILPFI